MRQSTIIDIATRLGISPSTVSRALSDHPDVKEDTKRRVREVAQELDYSPNPIARSLKSSQTMTIGVIVPEIKHDFFASAISGIEDMATEAGYSILLCQSNESHAKEVINADVLVNHRVAGVIVSIAQDTHSSEHFQEMLKRKIPLVFFDRVCEDVETSTVTIDDYKSAFEAVSYIVSRGYKQIAHFAGPVDLSISRKRMQGFIDALKRAGRAVPESAIRVGGLHEKDGYQEMDTLIREGNLPDAIFAVNDPVAIGAFQRIKEAGLRIPNDIAIVGFSNNKITALVDPTITTVEQPSYEMGRKAAELLFRKIRDKKSEPVHHVLNTQLIIRGST